MLGNKPQSGESKKSKKDVQQRLSGWKMKEGEEQRQLRSPQRPLKGEEGNLLGGLQARHNLLRLATLRLGDKEPREAVQEVRILELDVQMVVLGADCLQGDEEREAEQTSGRANCVSVL